MMGGLLTGIKLVKRWESVRHVGSLSPEPAMVGIVEIRKDGTDEEVSQFYEV
jgi:hypothetical protein